MRTNSTKQRRLLNNLYRVGPQKPMGYLPISTLENLCGVSVNDIQAWAEQQGLSHQVFSEHQCSIASGALFVWSDQHVQALLDINQDILLRHRWHGTARAFVKDVARREAPPGSLYDLVGVMFADPRMIDTVNGHCSCALVTKNGDVPANRR